MKAIYVLFILNLTLTLSAQETAEKALIEAQVKHEEAITFQIKSQNQRFEQELQKQLRTAISNSDLEGAQLIKDQIASLHHNASREMVGTWNLKSDNGYSADFTFRSDGTGTRTDSNGKFHWFIRSGVFYVGLPQSASDWFYLPPKDGGMSGLNLHGHKVTLTKK